MNIDFPPPSNGVYNNAGSCIRLGNYLEHEDLKRIEKGFYTEGFFNLTEENLYKSQVVKDIDNNKAQLLKTDAKFYAIHISPSAKELQAMGTTQQEQAEAMRRYVREVFIPEYAKNFNKGLSAQDIKFYGKIHFDRDRSENNEGNMHCHIIVSRKDQANKIKLSPLTNHRNTKKGAIKGGFDRVNLFQQAEKGFDKLFNYNRILSESFEYYNTMKNGSISEQIRMQERMDELTNSLQHDDMNSVSQLFIQSATRKKQEVNNARHRLINTFDLGLYSALGIFSPEVHGEDIEELRKMEEVKRKKKNRGMNR
ncbi:clindamycin resistance transfer factor BtgB [Dysgonomonas sp. Marseille-P4677]|uniref:DUF5712 family protein n=1 Tax=Dysgonomonas sp. Marseille-P4677 TaxID=2364790 RepID=UPI0019117509|nr:DUF5712 family protein [Dysgonomonas sp. Marseille-P4677]MBK5722009.1 clindamycin resistance transfer factor BtgB [Dysgonomonas sp. Marseille-P4677]